MTRTSRTSVVIASRLFPPEPGAAAYRLGALARTLAEQGAPVEVLTTRPPSGSGAVHDPRGVRGHRWPVLRDAGGNVRGYLQFASFDGPLFLRLLFVRRPGAVIVEPPPTTGTVVRIVCALRRIPYVYYAGDVSSRAAEGIGVSPAVVAVLRRVESWAMSGAAAVLAVSDGVAQEVDRLTGGSAPVTVVGTGVDTEVFTPDRSVARSEHPTLVYAGTMSEIQGASVWVEAFTRVAEEFPEATLLLYGQGAQEPLLRSLAAGLPPGRVVFEGVASGARVATALSSAWAGLASLHPGVGYDYAFPTKMFASTACGTPVVYAGPGPGRSMVAEHDLGWASDWEPDAAADLLRHALTTRPDEATRDRLVAWTQRHASQGVVAGAAAQVVDEVLASSRRH
ncbi:MAG: glycosyltransferase family 4 protein [Pedococcus sp.]